MNGRVINARILGQSTFGIRYQQTKKSGKVVEVDEPSFDVFSVIDSTGKEKVWYFHDPAFGNDLTVPEMRSFIKGEQDARNGYNPLWTTIGGFAFGSGMTVFLQSEMVSLLYPAAYAGLMALPRVHVTPGSVTDPLMEGDPNYAYGYAQVGRTKRVLRGMGATLLGVATGFAVNGLQ